MRCVGLFAGIGGFELGLKRAGYTCGLLCENDKYATAVLRRKFPGVRLHPDISKLEHLPRADVVTAGFPCQDLSQVGLRLGIEGPDSGLVSHVFRLLENSPYQPTWLVLENVPFMLSLGRGEAMRFIANRLEALGYDWAYRVIDSRAFGLPQRRRRVILAASKIHDPAAALFRGDYLLREKKRLNETPCGFYWTEGNTGVGWAIDSIPTLKGGSRLSIPSPPAIWFPELDSVKTPDIRDAERLQGFPPGWTAAAREVDDRGQRARYRLIPRK